MTLTEQARTMSVARASHKRPASTTNVKLAMDYFDMSNNEAVALCQKLGLHYWGFHTNFNKMVEHINKDNK